MNRDPIAEAEWTLVGTSDDTDSTATITGIKEDDVDEQVALLVNAGWDVHVYEPVLKQTILGKPYCECHGVHQNCGYQDLCR